KSWDGHVPLEAWLWLGTSLVLVVPSRERAVQPASNRQARTASGSFQSLTREPAVMMPPCMPSLLDSGKIDSSSSRWTQLPSPENEKGGPVGRPSPDHPACHAYSGNGFSTSIL